MPTVETMVEPASLQWFIEYMGLRDTGVVPSVTPSEFLPSRQSMARFWGPRAAKGWTFDSHGSVIYEYYARCLYNWVLQNPWPISGVLPFHFARGLMAEALGVDVSWAEFAYKMCHPYQSRTGIPRILDDFRTLTTPLPDLGIVIPPFDPQELGLEDGDVDNPVIPVSPPRTRRNRRAPTPEESSIQSGSDTESQDIDTEDPEPESKRCRTRSGGNKGDDHTRGQSELKTPALRGLLHVCAGVVPVVEREKNSLKEALHTASLELQRRHEKVTIEVDRAKFVARKIVEKTEVLRKAVEEYDNALEVLSAAQSGGATQKAATINASQKTFVNKCESLVDSLAANVQVVEECLSGWEFRSKRQASHVSRARNEFRAAETAANEHRMKIHKDLTHLKALKTLLENL